MASSGGATNVSNQGLASDAEKALIEKMKAKFPRDAQDSEAFYADIMFLRFLRGYHQNVDEAVKQMTGSRAWRRKYDPENKLLESVVISPVDVPDVNERIRMYADLSRLPHWKKIKRVYPERLYHKYDKSGNPIAITVQPMISNLGGLLSTITPAEFLEYRAARVLNEEQLLYELAQRDKRFTRLTVIWDMHGLSKAHYNRLQQPATKRFFGDFDEESRPCFPELLNRLVIVNIPTWLMIVYSAVRLALPDRVKRKIVGVGIQNNLEALGHVISTRGDIDLASLPSSLGGSCPESETISWFLGDTYAPPQEGDTADDGEDVSVVQSITVKAGKVGELPVVVKAGERSVWGIQVTQYDVGLTVTFDGNEDVVKKKKISYSDLESGEFVNKSGKDGTLLFRFDNSESMFRSKVIEVSVLTNKVEESS
jgi:hypothetical protein